MADGNRAIQPSPSSIGGKERERRRNVVSRSDHSLRLEGLERGEVSARAAELWIDGEITAAEKREMVRETLRQMAAKNGVAYDG